MRGRAETAVDTSLLIAALAGWHERHEEAAAWMQSLLTSEGTFLLPAPCLHEAYAIFTRLPQSLRLGPRAALQLLETACGERALVLAHPEAWGWSLLHTSAAADISGGATYDLLIASIAAAGGARRLATLNPRDFLRLPSIDLEIVTLPS